MASRIRIRLSLLLAASVVPPAMAQTQAVIYPDGRVFVRRTIAHALVRGSTVVPLPNEAALPGSFVSLDSGISIISARAPLPGDPASLLRKAVGRRVVFRLSPTDTVGAVVVSTDPTRYQLADGSIVVTMPGIILFPADIVGPGRLASITVQSTEARSRFDVGYVMNGIWWQAHYTLSLVGRRGRLSGTALLTSEGVALDSAEITLLDGPVSRVQPALLARTVEERARVAVVPLTGTFPVAADSIRSYRLAGRHAIHPSEIASLPLMADGMVDVVRVISVPGILSGTPPVGRFSGGSAPLAASVLYHLSGAAGSGLIGRLPSGTARVYGVVGAGSSALVAEAVVPEPSVGGRLDLSAGPTGEVLATRTMWEGVPEQDTVVSASGSRTVRAVATLFDEAVRLQNRTDSAVVVEVVESRSGAWSVVSSSVPPEALAQGGMRFRIALPPRGSAVFTARLRVPVS
jgi:hypothetical protein